MKSAVIGGFLGSILAFGVFAACGGGSGAVVPSGVVEELEERVSELEARVADLGALAPPLAQGTVLGYARVASNGTSDAGWMSTGATPTSFRAAPGQYFVTWPGKSVSYNVNPLFVMPQDQDRASYVWSTVEGKAAVQLTDLSGQQADGSFWIMVLQDQGP